MFFLNMENRGKFLGLYFDSTAVLRLAQCSKILGWVVVGVYAIQWLVQALAMINQVSRGFWTGMGFTDISQNILFLFEQPLRGVVYYVVLQGVAQGLMMFMDIEDNTRRAASFKNGK